MATATHTSPTGPLVGLLARATPGRATPRAPLDPLRRLRRRLLTPPVSEVDEERRGFMAWEHATPPLAPSVGGAFLRGFGVAMEARRWEQVPVRVSEGCQDLCGFAMEGAGMAAGIREALEPWQRGAFARLLAVSGERHAYMLYVGLGWALARLPRLAWPDLRRYDPLLRPLVLDGYGFHECFFNTRKTLEGGGFLTLPRPLPELGRDTDSYLWQGVGRALWFVCAADPETIGSTIESRFPTAAHAPLWSGAGLAAAYAGGVSPEVRRKLVGRSGEHHGWLRQGASFGIEARYRAGTAGPDTEVAAEVLCELDPTEIRRRVEQARPPGRLVDSDTDDLYNSWRAAVAATYDA